MIIRHIVRVSSFSAQTLTLDHRLHLIKGGGLMRSIAIMLFIISFVLVGPLFAETESDDLIKQEKLGSHGNIEYSYKIESDGDLSQDFNPILVFLEARGKSLKIAVSDMVFDGGVQLDAEVERSKDIIRIRHTTTDRVRGDFHYYDECFKLNKTKTNFEKVTCSLFKKRVR